MHKLRAIWNTYSYFMSLRCYVIMPNRTYYFRFLCTWDKFQLEQRLACFDVEMLNGFLLLFFSFSFSLPCRFFSVSSNRELIVRKTWLKGIKDETVEGGDCRSKLEAAPCQREFTTSVNGTISQFDFNGLGIRTDTGLKSFSFGNNDKVSSIFAINYRSSIYLFRSDELHDYALRILPTI